MTPHAYRRQSIHGCFIILIGIILFMAFGCTPKHGCYGTRGMSGYSYCPSYHDLKAHKYDDCYGWVYCIETRLMTVMDKKTGKLVCSYYEPIK